MENFLQSETDLRFITLGIYDFEKFSVILGSHDNPEWIPITATHESQHQRLNSITNFGKLLKSIAEKLKLSNRKSDNIELNTLFQFLIDKCSLVHEMQATFISIVEHDAELLVNKLPLEYKTYFDLMNSTVKYLPKSKYFRSYSAWILSEIAMTTSEINFSDLTSKNITKIFNFFENNLECPNERMKIIHQVMQSFDFEKFEKLLIKWGSNIEEINAFKSSNIPSEIAKKIGNEVDDWVSILDGWNWSMKRAFYEHFEPYFPNLENSRADSSARNLAEFGLTNYLYSIPNRYSKVIEVLIDSCEQRISFYPLDSINVDIINFKGLILTSENLNTFIKLKTTYLVYFFDYKSNNESFHVLDYLKPSSVSHIIINNDSDSLSLLYLSEPIISITEINTLFEIDDVKKLNGINFLGNTFLYLSDNPIKMLLRVLKLGYKIEWTVSSLGYDTGPVNSTSGVQIFLYWIENLKFPVFHLSNDFMFDCLIQFIEILSSDNKNLVYLDPSKGFDKIDVSLIPKLFDHPSFLYYLSGTTASKAVKKQFVK